MDGSILLEIKKLLGLDPGYTAFDVDVIIGINSAISSLIQFGAGDEEFCVTSADETWDDFDIEDTIQLGLIKQYVYLKTKRVFDPSMSSSVNQTIDNEIKELEWRICAECTTTEDET